MATSNDFIRLTPFGADNAACGLAFENKNPPALGAAGKLGEQPAEDPQEGTGKDINIILRGDRVAKTRLGCELIKPKALASN
jgi:hypothetical protein